MFQVNPVALTQQSEEGEGDAESIDLSASKHSDVASPAVEITTSFIVYNYDFEP